MRFHSYHPAITLMFFAAVVFCALTWTHPVLIAVSLTAASTYAISLAGSRGAHWIIGCLIFALLWGAWFATYNHFGVTPLAETPDGNFLTLEAILSGLDEGLRLAATILWLFCAVQVFTADKIIYLLSRISPKLSLLVAVAFRAVPMTASHAGSIKGAQSGIGRGPSQGKSIIHKLRYLIGRISALVTWCIDRALVMSDSMRSRGSLLPHRSAYSLYRFDMRDRGMFLMLVALIALCIMATILSAAYMQINPVIEVPAFTPFFALVLVGYLAFCFLPTIMDLINRAQHR